MATATAELRKDYKRKDGTRQLRIRLKSGKQTIYYPTDYYISESQFLNGKVKKHEDSDLINSVVSELLNTCRRYFADCIINGRPVNLKNVFRKNYSASFQEYILKRAQQYKEKKKVIMWQKLSRYVKELDLCFKGPLYLDEIDADTLRRFEAFLVKNGNKNNTIAKKYGMLKQMFRAAVREGIFTGINPFEDYKIKTYPAKKEKLSEDEIRAVEALELEGAFNDARNLFLFSYYAKGARFENCIFLQRKDIHDGRIFFHTNKGKKYISVLISKKLQAILDQYPKGEFIFPYIKEMPRDEFEHRSVKDSANTVVNRYLKVVAGLAGIKAMTFHQARHSIAMNMKKAGIDMFVIQQTLGHSDYRTTEIYLKGLDDEIIDEDLKKIYGD